MKPEETQYLHELQQLPQEERTLQAKLMAEYMISCFSLDEMAAAAQRIEQLYWQSSNERRKPLSDQQFTDTAVDVLATAALLALDTHRQASEAKQAAKHWIINGKGAAHNAPFETRTYFSEIGIAAHL